MTKRILNIVLLISLVLILSFSANAEIVVNKYVYKEDFRFSSNNQIINTCACSTFLDVLTVKNTGDKPSIYTASTDNANVVIYPSNFVLSKGESKKLMSYIRTPCNGKRFDFSVFIETTTGLKKTIKQEVNVFKCQNLAVYPLINNQTINPCQEAKFKFLINNTDGFTETYDISMDKLANFATLSENPVVINASKSKLVELTIKPTCDVSGLYDINLNVLARNNKLNANVPLKLNILANYAYALDIGNSLGACNFDETRVQFKIKNNADIRNKYNLNIKGIDFIKLDLESVELNPKEEKTVSLIINPKEFGDYTFVLSAVSEFGNLAIEKNISLKVNDCYPFSLSISKDTVCSNEDNYIVLENQGTKNEFIKLELSNAKLFALEETSILLPSGESKEVLIKPSMPNKDANYELELTASLDNKSFSKKTSVIIKVTSRDKCYLPEIKPSYVKVDYSENLITYVLKNKGTKKATYVVSLDKPAFLEFDEFQVELEPGASKEFDVISVPKANETKSMIYKIKFNIYAAQADYAFQRNSYVRLVWCDYTSKIIKYKIYLSILLVLVLVLLFLLFRMIKPKGKLNKTKTKRLFILRAIATIIIIILFFLLFYWAACSGIAGKTCNFVKNNLQRDITIKIVNETLIEKEANIEPNITDVEEIEEIINETLEEEEVLEIINKTIPGIITIPLEEIENQTSPLIPEKPLCENYSGRNICSSSLYIKWNKNTQKTIDLANYFTDPDEQNLTFDYESLENISIKIQGSIVTLTPDKDWFGVNEQIFSASDSEGGETLSDIFVLHVENKEENPVEKARSFIKMYRLYVAFALILLFILVALYFFMKSERD
jgi:hypothetical protein